MKYVELAGGEKVPALGLGTWKMGAGIPTRQLNCAPSKPGSPRE